MENIKTDIVETEIVETKTVKTHDFITPEKQRLSCKAWYQRNRESVLAKQTEKRRLERLKLQQYRRLKKHLENDEQDGLEKKSKSKKHKN